MEEPNITDMEELTAAPQTLEYTSDEKKRPSSPSVHSNNDSKEREVGVFNEVPPSTDVTDVDGHEKQTNLDTAKDIVIQVINLDNDLTLNSWTFRMFLTENGPFVFRGLLSRRFTTSSLGLSMYLSLSLLEAILEEIYYFKPLYLSKTTVFLTVIAYVAGELMSGAIPRWGHIGRFQSPGPFNMKEYSAIVIMASSTSGVEALYIQGVEEGLS